MWCWVQFLVETRKKLFVNALSYLCKNDELLFAPICHILKFVVSIITLAMRYTNTSLTKKAFYPFTWKLEHKHKKQKSIVGFYTNMDMWKLNAKCKKEISHKQNTNTSFGQRLCTIYDVIQHTHTWFEKKSIKRK